LRLAVTTVIGVTALAVAFHIGADLVESAVNELGLSDTRLFIPGEEYGRLAVGATVGALIAAGRFAGMISAEDVGVIVRLAFASFGAILIGWMAVIAWILVTAIGIAGLIILAFVVGVLFLLVASIFN